MNENFTQESRFGKREVRLWIIWHLSAKYVSKLKSNGFLKVKERKDT